MRRAELHAGIRPAPRPGPRDIVAAFQRDLLRTAFVLTGDERRAISLSHDAFVTILTGNRDDEVEPEIWTGLLIALGSLYLSGVDAGAASLEARLEAGDAPADEGRQAAPERARLREALDLLDRAMRTALVLHDLGGLNRRDAAALTGYEREEFDGMLEWSRERVREAAGPLARETAQRLLASLAVDAPRLDLWPEIRPVVEALTTQDRRRGRRIVGAALALFLAGALASAFWLVGDVPFAGGREAGTPPNGEPVVAPNPNPRPTRPPIPTATPAPTPTSVALVDAALGSDLRIQAWIPDESGSGSGEQVTFAYDPDADPPLVELPTSTYEPQYVSPDGRWTVLYREEREGPDDPMHPEEVTVVRMLSVARDGVELGWEYEIPSIPGYWTSWDSAIIGDVLYVASAIPEPATLAMLDLETGDVIDTVALDPPVEFPDPDRGDSGANVQLIPFAEQEDPGLYAFVATWEYGAVSLPRWTRAIYRVQPDTLELELVSSSVIEERDPTRQLIGDFETRSARMLLDGTGLYQFIPSWIEPEPGLRILDFESGQVSTLRISFSAGASDGGSLGTVVSNDSRRLYAYSNQTGEVAVIDLVGRRVERVFPLDLDGVANGPISVSSMRLSHDGRWLYLIQDVSGQWNYRSTGPDIPPEGTPVWVVDLTTWRVIHQFDVPGAISAVHLDPGAERLHFVSQVRNHVNPDQRRFQITIFDTAGEWKQLDAIDLSDVVDRNANFWFQSMTGSYREIYGRTPVIDGIEPGDVEEYTTLPGVRVAAGDDPLPVGITLPVAVEFLDPATGEPLAGSHSHVRYDPDWTTTLVFEKPGAKSLITVSAEIAPGQQEGTIRLKETGVWSARVIVGDDDFSFTVVLPDIFQSVPTFEGDDGRLYAVRLETEPEEPVAETETLLRAVIVDAATGAPIPEDVSLVDGMPEEILVTFTAQGQGSMTRNLASVDHGIYEWTVEFWRPGRWQVRLAVPQPESDESRPPQFEVGFLDVAESPPPAAAPGPRDDPP